MMNEPDVASMLAQVRGLANVHRRQGTGRVTTRRSFHVDDSGLRKALAELKQDAQAALQDSVGGDKPPPMEQQQEGQQENGEPQVLPQQQPQQGVLLPRIAAMDRPWHRRGTGRVCKRFSFDINTTEIMAVARELQEEEHARQQAIAAAALRVLEEQRAQEAEVAQRALEEEIAQREHDLRAAAALLHAAAANLTADQHVAIAAAAAAPRHAMPQLTVLLQSGASPAAASVPAGTPGASVPAATPGVLAQASIVTLTPGAPSQPLSQPLMAPSLGSSLQWTPMEGVPERRLPPNTQGTRSRTPVAAAAGAGAAAAATPGVLAFTPIEGVPEKALGFKRTPPPPKFAFTPVEGVPERLWSQKRAPAKQPAQQQAAAELNAALADQAAKVAGVGPAGPEPAAAAQAAATEAPALESGAAAGPGAGGSWAGMAGAASDDDDCGGDEYYGDDMEALELADGAEDDDGAGAAAGSSGATGGVADGAAADGFADDADMASAQQHVDSLVQGILESSPHTPSNPLPLNLTSGGRSKDSNGQAVNQQAGSGAAPSGAVAAGAASVDVQDGSAATVQLPADQQPMDVDGNEEAQQEEQQQQQGQQTGKPTRASRAAAGTPYEGRMCKKRKSLAADGLATNDLGLRRTTRTAHKPLDYWRNESKVFKRDHQSLPTVAAYVTRTPNPVWPHSKEQPQRHKPRTKIKAPHK